MDITVGIGIDASPEVVWEVLEDIGSHTRWMADAASIEFVGGRTSGVGTRFECTTKVGPLRTVDVMEVTSWEPGREMGVAHRGLVTGEGRFSLRRLPGEPVRTWFTWHERLVLPRRLGGRLAEPVAKVVLTALWRRNLARLKQQVEQR